MTAVLRFIGDGIALIGSMVAWAFVTVINALVVVLGAGISLVFSVLPDLPDPPATPAGDWIAWLNWIAPVAEIITAATVGLAALLAFYLLRVFLNWVKGL